MQDTGFDSSIAESKPCCPCVALKESPVRLAHYLTTPQGLGLKGLYYQYRFDDVILVVGFHAGDRPMDDRGSFDDCTDGCFSLAIKPVPCGGSGLSQFDVTLILRILGKSHNTPHQ